MRTSTLAPALTSRFVTSRSGRDLAAKSLLTFDATATIELPADLSAVSDVELASTADAARERIATFRDLPSPSAADLASARALAGVIKTAKTELAARAEAKTGLGDVFSALDAEAEAEKAAADKAAADKATAEAAAAEKALTDKAAADAAAEKAGDAVVASAAPVIPTPRASDVRGAGGGDEAPESAKQRIALVAAPDAVGVAQGHVFSSIDTAAASVLARMASYPTGPVSTGARYQNGALRLTRPMPSALVAAGYDADEAIEYATSFERVTGGTTDGEQGLVAGGGWGSPSETFYEMVELEGEDGMFDVPEIQIHRGGIKYTRGPEFSAFRGKGFKQTEAQAIAGQTKTFYRIPDGPDFVEARAGVTGLGVTTGILQNKAYPEYVARVLRGLLVAHAHEVNRDTLADVAAGSTPVTVAGGAGATIPLLSAMELQAVDIRTKHSMVESTVLETALPFWVLAVLRKDLANRHNWNLDRIPNSAITAHFADRGVRVQFVKDWQDEALGQAAPATAWPATAKFTIYPAGTWVRGLGEVLSIETLYDSAGLAENEFTALFSEEDYLVTKRGHESRVVTVPLVADGSTPAVQLTKAVTA